MTEPMSKFGSSGMPSMTTDTNPAGDGGPRPGPGTQSNGLPSITVGPNPAGSDGDADDVQ